MAPVISGMGLSYLVFEGDGPGLGFEERAVLPLVFPLCFGVRADLPGRGELLDGADRGVEVRGPYRSGFAE
jgi:hypothetical protein